MDARETKELYEDYIKLADYRLATLVVIAKSDGSESRQEMSEWMFKRNQVKKLLLALHP